MGNLLKVYSICFLILRRLIDFALVFLELMIVKSRGIIGESEIEFFKFYENERLKQNQKVLKTTENLLGL